MHAPAGRMGTHLPATALVLAAVLSPQAARSAPLTPGRMVRQSARQVPLAFDVDVVVVGGSTGAVSAAEAAAGAGATVFLAAPRHYLGEDVCGPLRLWLPAGAVPTGTLARKIWKAGGGARGPTVDRGLVLPVKYEADRPSAGRHRDTTPPSALTDGLWGRPNTQSVQYDGDVNIIAELPAPRRVERACVMLYHTRDFKVGAVAVSVSEDKLKWRPVAKVTNTAPPQRTDPHTALALSIPVARKTRYVRFHISEAPDATRVLLGEVLLLRPAAEAASRPTGAASRLGATPLHVKRTLDEALLTAGVKFLHGCYVTDVLRDEEGRPCGIVMANRSGRQAVRAKVIVDATGRAVAARLAGARLRPFSAGPKTFQRVVIGGEVRSGENVTARLLPPMRVARTVRGEDGRRSRVGTAVKVIEYSLRLPLADDTLASLAQAEQLARDATFHEDQLWASESVFGVPPAAMVGRARITGDWPGPDQADLDAFRPAGVDRVYVVGGCADVTREGARRLLDPLALIDLGARVGAAAAAEAEKLPKPTGTRLPGTDTDGSVAGEVRERLAALRPPPQPRTIPAEARGLAVLGAYDVVVIGGGTSGAPAGIGAARRGAKTLVVEYQYGLGGVGTLGAISKYYHGFRGGFTKEVDAATGGGSWSIQRRMEWWRTALRKAGADIWFGCLGCGAFVRDGRVAGVIVATPLGRGVVLAKTVVDSTGAADIAAAAGAATYDVDAVDIAVQGTGLPPLTLGGGYANTDFTITDDTDVIDLTHLFIYTRARYGRAWDQGQLIDTRERRRIVGDFTMTILDQVLARRHADTIGQSRSDFDSHGYTTDPFFVLAHPRSTRPHTPYRCLLPKGLDGILVTGLGLSAHRDAIPMIRMQPDLQNTGYAAGVAAAMAARLGGATRKVDVRALQKHLVEIGALPASVLTDEDSLPLPAERIAAAVKGAAAGKSADRNVAAILAHPERSLPLLRAAYASADSDKAKLRYAHILAVMGDAAGADTLLAALAGRPDWDKGWNYRGMGQYGDNMSPMDKLIYALGRARDRRAVPAILEKVRQLDAASSFSHHRAVALALERLGEPAAAGPLAELLREPGVGGHAIDSVEKALARMKGGTDTSTRRRAVIELMLARALFRCGDREGLGRGTLTAYTRDLRGHFARHARAVLKAGPMPLPAPAPGSRE